MLFSFGREDDLDREAIRRLVASVSRLLEPGDALAATATSDLEFTSSVPYGGAYMLDHLWRRLRIDQIVGRVGQPKRGRRRDMTATEAGAVRPGRQPRARPFLETRGGGLDHQRRARPWPGLHRRTVWLLLVRRLRALRCAVAQQQPLTRVGAV
ncbi:hypothetical protein [Streptomyces sp. NPDC002588]|uniref:hypothetical protein n=1 Tax=Streptomyces sp. NPDC002588 TaxID=3154419 RepID=UPI0033329488